MAEMFAGNTFVQNQEDVANRYIIVPENRFNRARPIQDVNESQDDVQITNSRNLI